ncbi:MAG: NADH-quinone oxidoreductase subunit J [Acidimicrobiales bacterium]|nr:NADH-quinone oxidoreductase subunit J [Acidimicrobiales bacterium]
MDASNVDYVVFFVAGAFVLLGAWGVILSRNPVHSALSLVGTLFSVAVLFILQEAHFLAAVQVVVYAGAIVILFLFVIMLLGVDRAEQLGVDPIGGQRPVAVLIGAGFIAAMLTAVIAGADSLSGTAQPNKVAPPTAGSTVDQTASDIEQLGNRLFTDWVFAFELTGLLLTIAVVGAVVMVRKVKGDLAPLGESVIDERLAAYEARLEETAAEDAADAGSHGTTDADDEASADADADEDAAGVDA